jgi:hypothetical protein
MRNELSEYCAFFIASSDSCRKRRAGIPSYVHVLAILVIVGIVIIASTMGSYSGMLGKVPDHNALRPHHDEFEQQCLGKDIYQRPGSLRSITHGIISFRQPLFGLTDAASEPDMQFHQCPDDFGYVTKNAPPREILGSGTHFVIATKFMKQDIGPLLWPVVGGDHRSLREAARSIQR